MAISVVAVVVVVVAVGAGMFVSGTVGDGKQHQAAMSGHQSVIRRICLIDVGAYLAQSFGQCADVWLAEIRSEGGPWAVPLAVRWD